MIDAALLALRQAFSPPFRMVLFKSVGLALLLLILIGAGLQAALAHLVVLQNVFLDWTAAIASALGILVVLFFAVPPIISLVAGFFLDEIAGEVERTHYPADAPGREQPLARSLILAIKFAALVLVVNIGVLLLALIPGVNLIAWWLANGYLLGREYFELAAMRFRSPEEAKALRRQHRGRVFFGGLMIAAMMAIPIVNLATPLVATAFMVHIHKRVGRRVELLDPA
ncbi:sulfate transporter family protein [Agaricicola taiwanensis]|nr:sulfate transporter family protein [Agaricicola taiwanensis]